MRKRHLGLQHRWVYNIKKELREIGSEDVNWTEMTQDTVQWKISMMTASFHNSIPLDHINKYLVLKKGHALWGSDSLLVGRMVLESADHNNHNQLQQPCTLVSVILWPRSPRCQSQMEMLWSGASSTAQSKTPPS